VKDRALGPTLTVVAAVAGFATITIFTTLAMREGVPLMGALFLRYAIATLILVPVALAFGASRLPADRLAWIVAFGGGSQAATAWLTLRSLEYISAATLVFLFYSFPVWVTVISVLRGVERIDRTRLVALVMSLTGIAIMVGVPGSGGVPFAGAAFALSGSILYAIFIPGMNALQRGVGPHAATAAVAAGAAVIMLVVAAANGALVLTLGGRAWGLVSGLAVVATAIPLVLFLRGLASLGPVRTSIVSTVEPFFVSVLAAVFLDQAIALPTMAGGVLIAAAVVIVERGAAHAAA
jgi:drug/metabolite transporter (DMT)-like permease